MDITSEWQEVFEKFSYNNPFLGFLSLHLIVGQLLKDKTIYKQGVEEDPRVNYFYVQGSGSGKSTPLKMIVYVEECLGFNIIKNLMRFSDTYFTGSYSENGNERKALKGKLEEADIIHFDEGEAVFSKADYNQQMDNILNACANPINHPSNEITVGLKGSLETKREITVHPTASVAMTSYIPRKLDEHTLRKGLMGRYYFYPRPLSVEKRLENAMTDIDNVGERFKWRVAVDEILNELHGVRKFVDEHEELELDFSEAKPYLKQFIRSLYGELKYMTSKNMELVSEFVSRYNHKYYVIALHHAILNHRFKVEKEDVLYAHHYLKGMLKNQIAFIEELSPVKRELQELQSHYAGLKKAYDASKYTDEGYLRLRNLQSPAANKTVMLKKLCELSGISLATAYNRYKKLVNSPQYSHLIEEVGYKGDGGKKGKYVRVS